VGRKTNVRSSRDTLFPCRLHDPEQIASIAYQNKDLVYGILFRATAETLSTIAADPKHLGAEIGFFAVLHSWDRTCFTILIFIVSSRAAGFHLMVPGGSAAARLLLAGTGALRLFRRLFLKYLQETFDLGKLQFFCSLQALQDRQAFTRHLDLMRNLEWVVYAKPPFAGPSRWWTMSAATRTASPFPIIGSSTSKMAK